MATLTVKPSNTLGIKIQRVKKAYLAKKEIKGSEKTGETKSYTFRGTNNTSTKASKEKIATIIYKNIKGDLQKKKQQTTVAHIVEALKKDSYKKEDCIDIPLILPKIKFTKLTSASLGDEVYMVVETENMASREIKLNFKQGGDKKVVTDVESPIFVTQEGSKLANYLFTAKVGEFSKNESISNAKDFENHAICKIKLASTNEEDNKKYREALNKVEGKKALFYISMDAEPKDQNWFEVKYEEIVDNRPNLWYYGEGNWFEFSGAKVYKKGDKGKEVQEINIRLTGFGKGLLPKKEFTEKTEIAVSNFQKDFMKIEPTGIADYKTLEAIDKFCEEYKENLSDYECPCTNSSISERPDKDKRCTGFGKKQYKGKYKSSSKVERNNKYEYPGIHRSLLWGISAVRFYMKDTNYKVKTVFRGYRCWADNLHNPYHSNRTSTNHMGKAADLHFTKDKSRTKKVSDIEYIRENFFHKYLGAPKSGAGQTYGFGWKKNHFGLEPKKFNSGSSGATTWVHVDVREFDKEFLAESLFVNKQDKVIGEKLT
ncbi:peptidoglycan-binding domain-containing protein [Tenacibaculum discolor]|uniref:peptidoglycan-binding domain-containing protein n=1 Tax=Tenacibaculum discolor TaxID=361581 RepID=UPI000F59D5D2|nr:peptidoglycan-binding domain-containing protein [Tenacibaculum discolor]